GTDGQTGSIPRSRRSSRGAGTGRASGHRGDSFAAHFRGSTAAGVQLRATLSRPRRGRVAGLVAANPCALGRSRRTTAGAVAPRHADRRGPRTGGGAGAPRVVPGAAVAADVPGPVGVPFHRGFRS